MYTITDSICLKVISTNCLLVAIGNDLHYYQQIDHDTVHKVQVTNFYDKIHGIESIQKSPTEFHVIVYGGRELALVQIKDQNFVFIKTIQLSDWISNINFYVDELNSFCCLTSHSVALHFSIVWDCEVSERASIDVIKKLTCSDKSTLYTSLILGTTWNSTVFFGGTALGYVFIWREIDDRVVMLHQIAGHNTIISFLNDNIAQKILPLLSKIRPQLIEKIIATLEFSEFQCRNNFAINCGRIFSFLDDIIVMDEKFSDDKNKIVFLDDNDRVEKSPHPYIGAILNTTNSYLPIHSFQGVIFSINCNIEHGLMTTTSDDRSVKIWKVNFTTDSSWSNCTIKQMKSLYGHTARVFQCKVIVEDNVPYIVSIGEDSNVCVWSEGGSLLYRRRFNSGATLWNLDYNPQMKIIFICGSDGNVREVGLNNVFKRQGWTKEIVSNEILLDNEYLAKVKVMDQHQKVIALTSTNRLIYQNDRNDWIDCAFDSYKSCVLEKYERYIALAGYQRASVFEYDASYSLKLVYEVTDLQGMVRSFQFLNQNEYLLSDETGNCTFISRTSNMKLKFPLQKCKDASITAALKHNNFLLVSDRKGDLHLLEIGTDEIHHRHRLKQLHGTLGCTVLYSENGNFVTSGHDGTTKVIALDETCRTMSIILTKKLPVSWMERVICRTDNRKLYAGFNDKHFVIANNECDIVDEIDCGGGHRFWDLLINEDDGKFIFIRSKMLYSVTLSGYTDDQKKLFQMPLFKWHVKSCNSMKLMDMPNGNVVLVSGGDDNVLKFHKFNENSKSFVEHIRDMVQHISCIKALTVVELNPTETFVISGGGRAQICISKITLDGNEIDTKEVTNFMLNSTDFQRKRLGKSQMIDFDPETRFMSVSCTEDFQIFTGCSDGYIRQFYFNLTNNEITSINSIFYGKCILHTHYFRYEETKYLLTMATDGHICFWEISANNSLDSKLFHRLKHHASGINSFDIVLAANRFVIATGGDDQSIVVSSFVLKKKSIEAVETKHLHYHTAQVNGIKFSSNGSSLYSISVDQRLYELDVATLTPRQISTSTIADAKGLQLIQNDRILVYGSGIQLIKVKN